MAMSEGPEPGLDDEIAYSEYGDVDTMFLVKNGLGALTCVIIAALAAGLTMGLVRCVNLLIINSFSYQTCSFSLSK